MPSDELPPRSDGELLIRSYSGMPLTGGTPGAGAMSLRSQSESSEGSASTPSSDASPSRAVGLSGAAPRAGHVREH
jgi:hypothetical protein